MNTSDKTESMRIRMTPAQHAYVCSQASLCGVTASSYIRSLITRDLVAHGGAKNENKPSL